MKYKLSCSVIEDLLPLYIDQQTSSDTNQLIIEHCELCDDCRMLKNDLEKEIDYLIPYSEKRKRKRKFRKISIIQLLIVLYIFLLIGSIVLINLDFVFDFFYI